MTLTSSLMLWFSSSPTTSPVFSLIKTSLPRSSSCGFSYFVYDGLEALFKSFGNADADSKPDPDPEGTPDCDCVRAAIFSRDGNGGPGFAISRTSVYYPKMPCSMLVSSSTCAPVSESLGGGAQSVSTSEWSSGSCRSCRV